ncbi:hypothetical protein ACFXJ8_02350 [Nonomuraea sp. NPDC059194]|uniref:hypothetical protein n=1 Tax=Nonomuraea sp. NPDC059194 TaxID=3346764 RepID=UPI00367C00AC
MRIAIAAVLAVAVAFVGWVSLRMHGELDELRGGRAAGEQAMAAARTLAPDLLSYNYRTIDDDLDRAQALTTGELTHRFTELRTSLVPRATEQRTVQEVTVAGAAVQDATPDRVSVLLFVNMGTTKQAHGDAQPRQQVIQNRVRFVMVKDGSRWLVGDLSTLVGST